MEVYSDPMLVEVLTGLGGLKALDVVRILRTKGEITDFELAQIMGLSWNKARGVLYKLNSKNVVKFEKKKDPETEKVMYYWSLDEEKLTLLLFERRKDTLNKLRNKLMFEQNNNFYACGCGCTKVQFEQAMEMEFICPQCMATLNHHENHVLVDEISSYIEHIECSMVTLA